MDETNNSPDPVPGQSRHGDATFVGRKRELETLTAALEDAVVGRGRVVMLSGAPGIGKTRTAREFADLAEADGAKVMWGWCYEHQGAPPYWPWVLWTQSATCWGMPIETSRIPPTPTVTRVSRTVRRSSGVAESSRSHICSLRAFKDATAACPCSEVASQPDFYYEGDGVPGACIFVDGSDHLDPARQEKDTAARTALEDRGFRVITIRFDRPREEQVAQYPDVFGIGKS